ncbi:MAG: lipopolysaccharide biosynthesis protein [Acidobacteria bacterium]|nr:lipopolysaccharide biosynthesis protein [Acidobacteriota bacterium]
MMIEATAVTEENEFAVTQTVRDAAGGELRTLVRHSSHYLAGIGGTMALGLISFPIFTRVLPIAEFGAIDLAQRVLLLLTAGSKAGLQNAALRFYDADYSAEGGRGSRRYYSTMFFGVLLTAAPAVLLFLGLLRLTPQDWVGRQLVTLGYLVAALVLLRALSSILCSFLRVEERTRAFNITTVGTKACTIAVVCLLLPLLGKTASTYFTGAVAVEAAAMAWLTMELLRRGVLTPSSFDRRLYASGVAFGLPLVVYECAFAVLGSADRFLVRSFLGADALGFYSVAYGLALTANEFLITPLNLALIPIYMRLWNTTGREATTSFLTAALDYYLMAAAGILAIAAVSARDLVLLLASAKYAGVERLIPLLLAGLLIYTMHVFLVAGLLLHKKTLRMAGVLIVCALLNIGLNCVLLPRIGLMGAAISTMLSYSACILTLGWYSRRLLPLRIDLRSPVRYAVAGCAAWVAASPVNAGYPVVSLFAKAALASSTYLVVLFLVDPKARNLLRKLPGVMGWVK